MIAGIDIGGTKILVAVANRNMGIGASQKFPTPPNSTGGIRHITEALATLAGRHEIDAIGISAAGPLDLARGTITHPGNYAWRNVAIVRELHKAFQVPIVLENDANAAAFAETHLGAGWGSKTLLYVTISTGIGTGLVVDGHIYHGRYDTEGGHITIDPEGPPCSCSGRGHFEAIASGRAIERDFGTIAANIHNRADWSEIGRRIALGLSSLIAAYSPDRVVLGGGVGGVHFNNFRAPLMRHLNTMSPLYPLPEIVKAAHAETAPIVGSFLLARSAFDKQKTA